MKKILYTALALFVTFGLYSCYEDKGNYEYVDRSEIEITNIEKSYSKILLLDKLEITPDIKCTNPDDELEYLWTLYPNIKNENYDIVKIDTLATTKDLSVLVTHPSGKYRVVFCVKNKSEGGREWYIESSLDVVSSFSNGFLVFKELAEGSDLDLHTPNNGIFKDILLDTEGRHLKGKPLSIGQYYEFSWLNEETGVNNVNAVINPITDQEMAQVRVEDMKIIRDHKGIFYGTAPEEKPLFFFNNFFSLAYVSDAGYYMNYQVAAYNMLSAGKFGGRMYVNDDGSDDYSLDYNAAATNMGIVTFDNIKGRFLGINFNGDIFMYDDSKDEIKCNNITDKLIYMGTNIISSTSYGYAIFENPDTGEQTIYRLNLDNAISESKNPIMEVKTIDLQYKLANATDYATNRKGASNIYFVCENKLYTYDYERNVEELLTPEGFDLTAEITEIESIFFEIGNDTDKFNHLCISTYKAGEYKVYFYDVVGGKTYGAPKKVLSGSGKVHKVQYLNPQQGTNNRGSYSLSF